ncbi:nuclear transport factor 2 family protein [Novosphingobium album (ex Liu et al. 2023)]|uniref:Nuclear transport factor 2 family protein n=1 Tax=Novosphingobium album (ex Liu et al. 2023) TaxID=3031130 RepID=A0ABT5WPM2_9SPHN|nr:nuclear transport factor 2 family protein [Novosphingobium album (ex Liu et al. 2023)]MDE8651999.1 nuclear transport factor 2 family protein [Novosphingobium album (ex Liu et al. 2023)]
MPEITLEQRVRRLEALRAIDRLIGDLGRAFDTGPSAAALRRLFAPDARFVIDRYGTLEGRDAIAEGVAGNADTGFCWTLHYLVSPRVELAADDRAADVEFYLWEVATAASGRAYWIGGRYEARAVSMDGAEWRFTRLELKADLISHYPEGWNAKPDALAEA